jgi:hypothetical protein
MSVTAASRYLLKLYIYTKIQNIDITNNYVQEKFRPQLHIPDNSDVHQPNTHLPLLLK